MDFCGGLRWRALRPFSRWWTPLVDLCGRVWCWISLVGLWWTLGWALGATFWTSVFDGGDEIYGLNCCWTLVWDFDGDVGG